MCVNGVCPWRKDKSGADILGKLALYMKKTQFDAHTKPHENGFYSDEKPNVTGKIIQVLE